MPPTLDIRQFKGLQRRPLVVDRKITQDHYKSTKKWAKMQAKAGIFCTKVDGSVELTSDGAPVVKK
jgi:hypothetical protein